MGTIQIMILKTIPLQFWFIVHVFFIALPLVWPTPQFQILKTFREHLQNGARILLYMAQNQWVSLGFLFTPINGVINDRCLLLVFRGPEPTVPRGAETKQNSKPRFTKGWSKLTALRSWKQAGSQKERMGFQPSIFTEFCQNKTTRISVPKWLCTCFPIPGFLPGEGMQWRCASFGWSGHLIERKGGFTVGVTWTVVQWVHSGWVRVIYLRDEILLRLI